MGDIRGAAWRLVAVLDHPLSDLRQEEVDEAVDALEQALKNEDDIEP